MLFDLREHLRSPLQRSIYNMAGPLIERSLALRDFEDAYQEARRHFQTHPFHPAPIAWFESALKAVNVEYHVDSPADWSIPSAGPLVVVSNHPFGILDPLVLGAFLARHRPDMRFLANSLLAGIPEVSQSIIAVDPMGARHGAERNMGAMQQALRHLRAGGALVVFPSGEVAHYCPGRGIEESPWNAQLGALVRHGEAAVLPVYFPGRNGVLFQAAGLVHARLRTGLLLRELSARRNTSVELRVGHPIPFGKIRKFGDDESLTKYLRLHTCVLAQRKRSAVLPAEPESIAIRRTVATPCEETASARWCEEVRQLKPDGLLASQGNLEVYFAGANQIPVLLQEIGRLRELTFRQVGEGTGQEVDLDRFDRHYLHLFLWDAEKRQVAGAYRMGRADVILRELGRRGLYTSTLFKFEKPFLAHLESAVEMGRSFIRPEYQKNLAALPLVWKGISRWMAANPRYKKLFGPVSISQEYDRLSRQLIVEFLEDNRSRPELAALVKPRKPFRYLRGKRLLREFVSAQLRDVEDCSAIISTLEKDGKGLPILLKHYLRLNGVILSFNVDKAFSSVLDGLILVDLTQTDPRILAKYMGEATCRGYLAHHGIKWDAAKATG